MTSISPNLRRILEDRGEHDARCESCDRPLFHALGDEWEDQVARDADGETTFTICQRCIELEQEYADFEHQQAVRDIREMWRS